MNMNNAFKFAGRDTIYEPLTGLLRSAAQQLINQSEEAELQELRSQYSDQHTDDSNAVMAHRPMVVPLRVLIVS